MNPPTDLAEACREETCTIAHHELVDYASERPRWCSGCGDHGVLTAVQRVLRQHDIDPENVVAVSGIGCSSRLPHYLRAYGFHGIHGRALPLATGVRLARPELHVVVTMGDGDCFSIGGNHWLHSFRYNFDAVVLVLDNAIYALTKMQVSPTTPTGWKTRTTPRGSTLQPLNPLSAIIGLGTASFVAQTATWLPAHVDATIERAWRHRGLSFVRILQRCPVFMPTAFGHGGQNFPMALLEHPDGIPVDPASRTRGVPTPHDPGDLAAAQRVARTLDPAPMGLVYCDPSRAVYEDIAGVLEEKPDHATIVSRLEAQFDRYAVS